MKRLMKSWMLAAVLGQAVAVRSAASELADTDMVFPAAYTEDYAVDGDLGKAVWKEAQTLPRCMSRRGEPLSCKDEIKVLWSKTAIYVGATMWQDLSKASFKWDQRDMPVWSDDNIELVLYIPLESGKKGLFQFIMNPLGTVADLKNENVVWSLEGVETVARRHADRWTIECRIPFKGLMDRPVSGDHIGARFCRGVYDGTKRFYGSVPHLLSAGNSQRARFAKLEFRPPTGKMSAEFIAEGRGYAADVERKRFYRRYGAFVRKFAEISGGAGCFSRSSHPVHVAALAKVREMSETLAAFEKRHAARLAAKESVPAGESAALFAAAEKFETYAASHAYVVWKTDPWSNGSESEMPAGDAAAVPEKILFELAGNEREQTCLAFHGLLCGSRLDLRLWPEAIGTKCFVYSPRGQYLSSDSFEIFSEPFVEIEGDTFTMPLVKAPGSIVTVSPGRTTRMWVMFNSSGVSAGTYRTSLKFKPLNSPGMPILETPLEVKVWNFSLPETRDWPLKSFFWGAFSFSNDEVAQLQLAHDYHITHGWTQFHRYRYGMSRENNAYDRPNKGRSKAVPGHDFEEETALHGNQEFLEKARELNMRFVIGWSTPGSLDWFKIMTKRLLGMGFAYEDFVYKGLLRDEFVKADLYKNAKNRKAVMQWNTNLHFQATLLSTPPPTGATVEDMVKADLPRFYTQWTVIDGLIDDPARGPETLKMIRDAGKQVWSYKCARFMHNRKIRGYYRFYPWTCRMRGLDGVAMWTFFSPKGDGWDYRDGYDDGITWRGLDRKHVPTKQLQAFREGLEDVAYMDILERLLKKSGIDAKMRKEGERLLAERSDIIKADDQGKVDAWRLAVGRLADALSKGKKK